MFDFLGAKSEYQKFTAQANKLHEGIEQLQREREDLLNAPATRDDVKSMLRAWIAAQAEEYNTGLMSQLIALSRDGRSGVQSHNVNLANTANSSFGPMLLNRALCGLVGPALYESLAAMIDTMTWPANSRPIEERAAALEAIDKKLTKLIEQQRSLVTAARDAGLQVEGA